MDLEIDGLGDAEQVGSGGNAVVYRARDLDLDRWVAVKMLRLTHDEDSRRRFERERKVMARISNHPNVAPIYSSGFTAKGEPFLVMPFYANGSLDEVGRLDWTRACELVIDVAGAVQHAHDFDVMHRDLKPANIMMDPSGRPIVVDFGISQLVGGTQSLSSAITLTPSYAPPEAFEGPTADPRSDVYSLGATLHALIGGSPPFDMAGAGVLVALARVANDPPPDLRDRAPHAICELIELAMAKQPGDRPETAAEFARLLREATERSASDVGDPTPAAGPQSAIPHDTVADAPAWPPAAGNAEPERATATTGSTAAATTAVPKPTPLVPTPIVSPEPAQREKSPTAVVDDNPDTATPTSNTAGEPDSRPSRKAIACAVSAVVLMVIGVVVTRVGDQFTLRDFPRDPSPTGRSFTDWDRSDALAYSHIGLVLTSIVALLSVAARQVRPRESAILVTAFSISMFFALDLPRQEVTTDFGQLVEVSSRFLLSIVLFATAVVLALVAAALCAARPTKTFTLIAAVLIVAAVAATIVVSFGRNDEAAGDGLEFTTSCSMSGGDDPPFRWAEGDSVIIVDTFVPSEAMREPASGDSTNFETPEILTLLAAVAERVDSSLRIGVVESRRCFEAGAPAFGFLGPTMVPLNERDANRPAVSRQGLLPITWSREFLAFYDGNELRHAVDTDSIEDADQLEALIREHTGIS